MNKKIKDWKSFNESINPTGFIQSIEELIETINLNLFEGWKGEELDESYQCVIVETITDSSGTTIEYSGWFEQLEHLMEENPNNGLEPIFEKIKDSITDLWNERLTETFEACLIESIDESGISFEYNGWYEDLQTLV